MKDAVDLFAAFCYVVPGMPMIYTGQLVGNHHRLAFFEKDLIDMDKAYAKGDLYKRLNDLRVANKALQSPEVGAPMEPILNSKEENVFSCVRQKDGNTVIAIMNMSDQEQTVNVLFGQLKGKYIDFDGKKQSLKKNHRFTLKPWEFKIFTK